MEPVSIVRCPEYRLRLLKEKLLESIRLVGFNLSCFNGKKVLLKPNLLSPSRPEQAVTTHPLFVRAAAELVLGAGGKVLVGDSGGLGLLAKTLKVCGLTEALSGLPVEFGAFNRPVVQANPGGTVRKEYTVVSEALECDCILNLPKLKTHGQMGLTGAAKNLFGLIPGLLKARTHMEAGRDARLFARILLEFCYLNRPCLSLVDGITAMDGNGPGSGDPFSLGLVLAGMDPSAIDSVIADIVGFDRKALPLLAAAEKSGLGTVRPGDIEVRGEPVGAVRARNFRPASDGRVLTMIPEFILRRVRDVISVRPRVIRKKCTRCGECRAICPSGAVTLSARHAVIDDQPCIRCLCCQEICPSGAILARRSLMGEAIVRAGRFVFRRRG